MGTVTKVYVTTEQKYSRAAKGMVESTTYDVRIEYQPLGDILPNSIAEDLNDKYSEGDIVPVIYKKDAVYDGYIAEKDWLTGAYLPITKYYNAPLRNGCHIIRYWFSFIYKFANIGLVFT